MGLSGSLFTALAQEELDSQGSGEPEFSSYVATPGSRAYNHGMRDWLYRALLSRVEDGVIIADKKGVSREGVTVLRPRKEGFRAKLPERVEKREVSYVRRLKLPVSAGGRRPAKIVLRSSKE